MGDLHAVATHCNTLEHTTTHCNTLPGGFKWATLHALTIRHGYDYFIVGHGKCGRCCSNLYLYHVTTGANMYYYWQTMNLVSWAQSAWMGAVVIYFIITCANVCYYWHNYDCFVVWHGKRITGLVL